MCPDLVPAHQRVVVIVSGTFPETGMEGIGWVGRLCGCQFFFWGVARVINSLERATAKRAVIGRYNLSIKCAKRVYY